MLKRKGYLRKQVNQSLDDILVQAREEWLGQKTIIEKSIEPNENVLYELNLAEVRYFFLLREAKVLFSDKPS